MGLLSNDKTRAKIVTAIKTYHNKLAFLCYFAGLSWFLALAYPPLNARTYFSENALIPGLVESDFYHDHGAANHYKELKEYFKSVKQEVESTPENKRDESLLYTIPTTWLESKFRSLGLDTYVHNYSFQYPMAMMKDQKFYGHNVYGILRAPKAASTEAVVLSVPFRSMYSEGDKTAAGIAVALGLAKAFRRKTYWAKDVIFLVTEHDSLGMQAWLAAYHYSKLNNHISPGELPARSGPIQAAINLELGSDQISRINVKMVGLNGQLPNLDLVNTVVKLAKQQNILPVIQKRKDQWLGDTFEGWYHAVKTMFLMMWHQASGFPSGNHGLFHRYNIEAVTVQGIKLRGSGKRNVGFTEVGRMLEGIFRSLNNLMERFHQSFFFYLLPATDRYVSIGLYMPPFGLLAAPILIKAVALWIAYSSDYIEAAGEAGPKTDAEKNQESEGKESDSLKGKGSDSGQKNDGGNTGTKAQSTKEKSDKNSGKDKLDEDLNPTKKVDKDKKNEDSDAKDSVGSQKEEGTLNKSAEAVTKETLNGAGESDQVKAKDKEGDKSMTKRKLDQTGTKEEHIEELDGENKSSEDSESDDEPDDKAEDTASQDEPDEKTEDTASQDAVNKEDNTTDKSIEEVQKSLEEMETKLKLSGFTPVIPPIVMSFSFGLLSCFSPPFFIDTATALKMKPGEGLIMGIIAIFVSSLMYPKMLRRKAAQRESGDIGGPNWKLLKCIILLLLGIMLGAISVLNISLAFFITAIWAPVVSLVQPRKSNIGTLIQYLMLLLVSPLGLFFIACVVHEQIQSGFTMNQDLTGLLHSSWLDLQHGLLHAVVDSYFYSNWIYSIVTLLIWPCWLVMWALVGAQAF